MRSILLSHLSQRQYSDEQLGLIANTAVFRVLALTIDKIGPRFWLYTFALLQLAVFSLATWDTAYGHERGHEHNPLRTAVSLVALVINAVFACKELVQVHVYRKMEIEMWTQIPHYSGSEHWYRCFAVYSFLLIGCGLSLPAWPVLAMMSKNGSTKARAKGLNGIPIPLSACSGSIRAYLTNQPF